MERGIQERGSAILSTVEEPNVALLFGGHVWDPGVRVENVTPVARPVRGQLETIGRQGLFRIASLPAANEHLGRNLHVPEVGELPVVWRPEASSSGCLRVSKSPAAGAARPRWS